MQVSRSTLLAGLLAAAQGLIVVSSATAAVTFDTRALSGQAAPGTGSGVAYSTFDAPALSAAGRLAFTGFLAGNNVNTANERALWSEAAGSSGSPTLLAREGSRAPGTPSGVVYNRFNTPILNDAGQTSFRASLAGTGIVFNNSLGIWSEAAGSMGNPALVARAGNPAPGVSSGIVYTSVSTHVFSANGQNAYTGTISGTGVNSTNSTVLWSESAGSVGNPAPLARTGSQAPGTASGTLYRTLAQPVINDAGQLAFRAGLINGTTVDFDNNVGIYATANPVAAPTLIARKGSQAPGTATGVLFDTMRDPVINDDGRIAFKSELRGTGVTFVNDQGIWSATGNLASPALVVRTGNAAPGTSNGILFSDFSDPVINDAGLVAFLGEVSGSTVTFRDNEGIWSQAVASSSSPGLVAREGNQAPDTSAGVLLGSLGEPTLNAAGQVAFTADLTGNGITANNDRALYATDPAGLLTLVLRTGSLFDIDDSPATQLRTVADFDVLVGTGNGDGRPSAFNDAGQLAFAASFTDGSAGLFVASLGSATSNLPGDYSGNGSVEQGDLDLVLANWGSPRVGFQNADAFSTANVDQEELDAVLSHWGSSNTPNLRGLAVPEPTIACVLLAAPACLLRRRASAV